MALSVSVYTVLVKLRNGLLGDAICIVRIETEEDRSEMVPPTHHYGNEGRDNLLTTIHYDVRVLIVGIIEVGILHVILGVRVTARTDNGDLEIGIGSGTNRRKMNK